MGGKGLGSYRGLRASAFSSSGARGKATLWDTALTPCPIHRWKSFWLGLLSLLFCAGLVSCGRKEAASKLRTDVMLTIAEAEAAWRGVETARKSAPPPAPAVPIDKAPDERIRDAEYLWRRTGARVSRFRGKDYEKYHLYEGYEKDQIDAFLRRKDVRQNIDNDRGEVRDATNDEVQRQSWRESLDALEATAARLDAEWNETWTKWNANATAP
jgi:hypothetical protein